MLHIFWESTHLFFFPPRDPNPTELPLLLPHLLSKPVASDTLSTNPSSPHTVSPKQQRSTGMNAQTETGLALDAARW